MKILQLNQAYFLNECFHNRYIKYDHPLHLESSFFKKNNWLIKNILTHSLAFSIIFLYSIDILGISSNVEKIRTI